METLLKVFNGLLAIYFFLKREFVFLGEIYLTEE